MKQEQQGDLDLYCKEIERYPLLTRKEEHELAVKSKQGDKKATDKLVVSNLRFVVKVAHGFSGYLKYVKVGMLDLIQEGNIGLMRAVNKFDPSRGYRLVSYAVWWIKVGMQNFIMKNFSLVKVGTTTIQRKLFFKLGSITEILHEENPDRKQRLREDLAKLTNVSSEQIEAMETRMFWKDKSVSDLVVNTEYCASTRLVDLLEEKKPWTDSIEHKLDYHDACNAIYPAMEELNPREKIVMQRRWLEPEKDTLREIGKDLNVTRERVRQIEYNAKKKMKKALQGETKP